MATKSAERSIKSYFASKAGENSKTPTQLRPTVRSPPNAVDSSNDSLKQRLPESDSMETQQGRRKMAKSLKAVVAPAEDEKADSRQFGASAQFAALPNLDFNDHVRELFTREDSDPEYQAILSIIEPMRNLKSFHLPLITLLDIKGSTRNSQSSLLP